ncbi:hypothetical protein TNIN_328051 [Trichonephila inaurata madagascariensis]|uniref:Uncharacterized protein n=1 Tax=Trichonephila inaurata madagascariensis TaxID=2747483 RepID=A0A8X6WP84_9ARAC|nr:hypothetical protein TNIN_328051 [Trichonephila inaurata madagascariensis]
MIFKSRFQLQKHSLIHSKKRKWKYVRWVLKIKSNSKDTPIFTRKIVILKERIPDPTLNNYDTEENRTRSLEPCVSVWITTLKAHGASKQKQERKEFPSGLFDLEGH